MQNFLDTPKDLSPLPVVLSIAGSDSGGGAGIQADLLTFSANGVFGTTAITCLTAQNPDGVSAIEAMPAPFVRAQVDQVHAFFQLQAIKTGMLFNADIISTIADFCSRNPHIKTVIDPVMVATSGAILLQNDAIDRLKKDLLPKASLVTPNLDEAAVLLGVDSISTHEDMISSARKLAAEYKVPFLLKGGHLAEGIEVKDILAWPDGKIEEFAGTRIEKINTHGSGCTLSSAIAANLGKGWSLENSIGEALTYLRNAMRNPLFLNGIPYIRH